MSKQSDEVNSPNCGFAGMSNRIVDSATSGNALLTTFLRRVSHCFLKSAKGLDDVSGTVVHTIAIIDARKVFAYLIYKLHDTIFAVASK